MGTCRLLIGIAALVSLGASPLALAEEAAVSATASAGSASAPVVSLEDQLKELEVPGNRAPDSVSREKLYAVQNRFVGLRGKHELSAGGGRNFTSDSFLSSSEVLIHYRYHLNDRWALGLGGGFVFNDLSSGGKRLLDSQGLVPDVAYAKNRIDLNTTFNAFYGKFRLSMDQVFYFDQYFQVGAGVVELSTGRVPAGYAEAGFAFWAGRQVGMRLGFRDAIYNEKRQLSSGLAHNLIAHVDVSLLLGDGR